jgi:hypothetical protein
VFLFSLTNSLHIASFSQQNPAIATLFMPARIWSESNSQLLLYPLQLPCMHLSFWSYTFHKRKSITLMSFHPLFLENGFYPSLFDTIGLTSISQHRYFLVQKSELQNRAYASSLQTHVLCKSGNL